MDAIQQLDNGFSSANLHFPETMIDFIERAANRKSRAQARLAVYTAIITQILHKERLGPPRRKGKTILAYAQNLLHYIHDTCGGQTTNGSVVQGSVVVNLVQLPEMQWG